jgi:putative tryptophan/tyrosine transport system substrate-binding protein
MPPQNQAPEPAPQAPVSAPLTSVVPDHGRSGLPLILGGLVLVAILAGIIYWLSASPVSAPQPSMQKKVGMAYFPQGRASADGFKQGLASLGYEVQYFETELLPSPTMFEEMKTAYRHNIEVDGVDMLFADHEQQALAAVELTRDMGSSIPIVFLSRFHDPVEYGIIASYQSSGNNATGVTQNLQDVSSRILQFFREIDPEVTKVGVFGKGFMIPGVGEDYFAEIRRQAERLGFEIVEYTSSVPPPQAGAEFARVAAGIKDGDIDAIVHIPGHFYTPQHEDEYKLAKRLGIPHHTSYDDMPGGGHFAFSSNFYSSGEQAARIADKIFRGTKPADIPIEYGSKNLLLLNDPRALETGIEFSENMRYLADEYDQEAGIRDL